MFRLTEFRELGGDLRNRTMVLADLHTSTGVVHRGGVAVGGKSIRHRAGCRGDGLIIVRGRYPGDDCGDTPTSERSNGLLTAGLPQSLQSRCGKRIIVVAKRGPTAVSETKGLGGTAATATTSHRSSDLNQIFSDQNVQMATYSGGRETEVRADGGGTHRSVLE